jgi:hypothetical protein
MDFDFNKMTACDQPFYGVMSGKTASPIGRVCLLITFGTQENFRIEYLTFEHGLSLLLPCHPRPTYVG